MQFRAAGWARSPDLGVGKMLRRSCFVGLLTLALLGLASGPAFAETWFVDATVGSDTNDGTSPASAFRSITKGMATAVSGDSVSVMEGLYAEASTGEGYPIDMKSGVLLQGGGASGTVIMGNGAAAVLRAISIDASASIDGFTVTGGYPGIECSYSSLAISNNIVSGNDGGYSGAGIHTDNGALTISGNTITDNHATYGGGIACEDNDASIISGNEIAGNTASGGGGGICAYYHADPVIVGNAIAGNSANLGGGLLSEASSLPLVSGNSFTGNTTSGPGGGLMGYSAGALVTNCVFSDNDAGADGGAIALMNSDTSQIINTTVANNTSGAGSAGIGRYSTSWPASALISNCILWHNDNPWTTGWDDLDSVFVATYSDLSDRPGNEALHTLSEDPLFADDASGDYHLTAGSPCIDSGDGSVAPVVDLEGTLRPQGEGVDMGAYEFAGPVPDTTQPTITIASPQDGAVYVSRDGTVFEFTAEDDESGVAVVTAMLDTDTPVASGDPLPVKPGAYALTVVAEDGAGNVARLEVEFTVANRGKGGGPRSAP